MTQFHRPYGFLLFSHCNYSTCHFCRAMICKRGLSRHVVSVCPSVCLSRSYILPNKLTHLQNFFRRGVASHSSFSVPNFMAIFRREPHNGGVECRWSRQKSRFWAYIWLHCVLLTPRLTRCCQYDAAGPQSRKLWHLSLLVSGDVDSRRRQRNVYDKKPQRYAKDNRTVHLIARSYKSVAYVTNNKRLYSTFCTVKAIYTDRHEASRGLFAKAELLVKSRFSYWQSKYHDVEILDHSNSNSLEMAPFDTSFYSIVFHC